MIFVRPTEPCPIIHLSAMHSYSLIHLPNGVPQGSTLSPTLFNIYISDIPQTTSMQYGYADDLALLAADDTWEKVEETLNHDMQAITNYLQKWRLILSTAKTTSTAFHLNNRDSQRQLAVSVNGTLLPNCEHPVYLGVTLDRTLTYKHHIEALRRKVNVRNGLLRCLAGSTWAGCVHLYPSDWSTSPRVQRRRVCITRVVSQRPYREAGRKPERLNAYRYRLLASNGDDVPSRPRWNRAT